LSYFIAVQNAMQEYGIRDAQFLEIINQGWAAPYDEQGRKLTPAEFHSLIQRETESNVRSLEEELYSSLHHDNLGWSGGEYYNLGYGGGEH
jgi:hypothetical protein